MPTVRESLQKYDAIRTPVIHRIETEVLRDAASISDVTASAVRRSGDRAIDQAFELFDPLARTLGDGAAQRIVAGNRIGTRTIVVLLIGATLALLAAYLVGRTLTRPPVDESRIRGLVERILESAGALQSAMGDRPANLGPARKLAARIQRIDEAARQTAEVARQLDETTDEMSVAALNVAIEAAAGGAAVAPQVDQLADQASAASRRLTELARTIEAETAGITSEIPETSREFTGDESSHLIKKVERLTALTQELRSASGLA